MTSKIISLVAALGAFSALAANPIDEKNAINLKPTTSRQSVDVTLYKDSSGKNYVAWYKMTLSKGKAYTIWVDGKKPAGASIDIYAADPAAATSETQMEPSAFFDMSKYGEETRWIVDGKTWSYEDSWGGGGGFVDDSDFGLGDDEEWDWGDDWVDPVVPNSWTYYIVISGAKGETCKLWYIQKNDVPQGVEQNPLTIKPSETDATKSCEFKSGEYFVEVAVTAGRRYSFATTNGKSGNAFSFAGFPGDETDSRTPWNVNGYNGSVCYIPSKSGTAKFRIVSTVGYGAKATLKFRVDPVRAIGKHKVSTLTAGKTVTAKPGYLNSPNLDKAYFDAIIDEVLYKFTAAKGKRYVIGTTGAKVPLMMRVYDSKGNVLATNTSGGEGSLDVRCSIDSQKAKTTFYVGVCENLPLFDATAKPQYKGVKLLAQEVKIDETTLVPLNPVPVDKVDSDGPATKDKAGKGPNTLDMTRWYNTFTIAGRGPAAKGKKGITYALATTLCSPDAVADGLTATVYWLSGKTKKIVATGAISPNGKDVIRFTADTTRTYYVQVSPAAGAGCDCSDYLIHAVAYIDDEESKVGSLVVAPKGAAAATWVIGQKSGSKVKYETTKYGVGESLILPVGTYTVKYNTVKGYSNPDPATKQVTIKEGVVTTLNNTYYSDKYDPKDNDVKKVGKTTYAATAWSLKTAPTTTVGRGHTLWKNDPADYFVITPKDGYLYDFTLTPSAGGDAVFSVLNSSLKVVGGKSKVTSVTQLAMPASSSKKYYIKVEHRNSSAKVDGTYDLDGFYTNVGAIKFSKTSLTAKDTATSVKLTVNRSGGKDGAVKVRYTTVNGSAKAGENYVAQTGLLEWKAKDSKAKTIEIKLIPKLGAWYAGGDKSFTVKLEDAGGQYPAPITTPKATVKITETSKKTVTQESVYKKKAAKKATVKTEKAALRGGTYYGIVGDYGNAAKDGQAQFASVTLTVGAKDMASTAKDTLSAKVALAGKTYTFKPGKKDAPWDGKTEDGRLVKTLSLEQKVNKKTVVNTLRLEMKDGTAADDWRDADCRVTLTMNLSGKVVYTGSIYRQNAKVQAYLNAVVKFAGYYTVALKPTAETLRAGVPSGNGYLTLTVSNKGQVKVTGLLADNTKVSYSATACALRKNSGSAVGYDLIVPVFQAKSPYCFAAELRLTGRKIAAVQPDGKTVNPDGKAYDLIVDSTSPVYWNNDNEKLTYKGDDGWAIDAQPVGGWYDTVLNLQNYYKDYAFSVDTASISEFPKEVISTKGYKFATEAKPDGTEVDLEANAFATDKKSLVKSGKVYDLKKSVNPCNVQVKLARATGIVTGSCSVWSKNSNGTKQKEITGFKHYGILLLQRDELVKPFGDDVFTAGFLHKSVKVGKRSTVFSVPFNITGEDSAE